MSRASRPHPPPSHVDPDVGLLIRAVVPDASVTQLEHVGGRGRPACMTCPIERGAVDSEGGS